MDYIIKTYNLLFKYYFESYLKSGIEITLYSFLKNFYII